VIKKLDVYSPLGYSCVGEVIDIAPDIIGFRVGDCVACGGSKASHAEMVTVPEQLCVQVARSSKLEAESHLRMAAYNTLGAIALQRVRQADLRLWETCAVIGMGLLGHLTAVLLSASGVKIIGIDINQELVELGRNHYLDLALVRDDSGIESKIQEFTNSVGCDAVIITATSTTLDPIHFAGSISRKKGQ
jgi:NADPH:quinone reductase-like Zn-dependent oxidoreductase